MNKKLILPVAFVFAVLSIGGVMAFTPGLYGMTNSENIKLCYKDANGPDGTPGTADDWTCQNSWRKLPRGDISYRIVGTKLFVRVNAADLEHGYNYQLTLNGDGTNNHGVDDILAGMSADPWVSGKWGSEGWYNFKMAQTVDRCENHRIAEKVGYNLKYTTYNVCYFHKTYEVDLPEGIYEGVKFLVKRTTGADGHGGDFKAVLMETQPMNFVIAKP